ncbi:amino acid adenylation domain-containing protein [Mediterraneibacter gnavus]|uniref:amino acid adenylation domain-containing protein n=1 Tax=Mediterraneibacter gnavus TaxID=33038 RepID=UPI0034A19CFA
MVSQLYEELGFKVGIKDNLLEIGLNSLNVMKMMSAWKKRGYAIRFSDLLRYPTIEGWAKIIVDSEDKKNYTNLIKNRDENIETEIDMYKPFELTDVQYAYWFGRTKGQYLGNIGCHGYFEVTTAELDLERLQESWEILFEFHPMLRTKFLPSGQQVVMRTPFQKRLNITDLSNLSRKEQDDYIKCYRNNMSHRLLDIEKGQVISLEIFELESKRFCMCFEIDLLVCDVASFRIILRDFAAYYARKVIPPVTKEWNFASYIQKIKMTKKEEIKEAEKYWEQVIPELPEGPNLPIINKNVIGEIIKFKRHEYNLNEDETAAIKQRATEAGVTIATVMLTAYGYVLSKWSENKRFLINLPMFNREAEAEIDEVVADFTNLLLVPVDFTKTLSFYEYLKVTDQYFKNSIDHSAFSGVQILRKLKKIRNVNIEAPFVFSCNLGGPLITSEFQKVFGNIDYMITQTPQVLLDFQLFDDNDGLHIVWDTVEQAFPKGMVQEMFEFFINILKELSARNNSWNDEMTFYSSSQMIHRAAAEKFEPKIEEKTTLPEKILEKAKVNPDKIALIDPLTDTKLSYQELSIKAKKLAGYLMAKGVKNQDNIILIAERKLSSIIAMIAIQLCGCAYIPMRISQPRKRLEMIIQNTDTTIILGTKEDIEKIGKLENVEYIDIIEGIYRGKLIKSNFATPEGIAYIIFTSGSTGVPKGVAISHQSVMNTIDTINKQYSINEMDIGLGVSSYDFDLSVYDVFGLLIAGGSLVIVPESVWRDAQEWSSIIEKYCISVWNSVPTLLKMLLTETEFTNTKLTSLRKVFLSGDWTSLDIPERIGKIMPNAKLTVMGGATEASIWSNYIDIELPIPEEWKSIPYGKPLKNQWYRVVDSKGIDCPNYVKGELLIGGSGVTNFYVGDRSLTNKKIVREFGKRWYKTGDLGCFWEDGTIEFIGRKDNQVKIRGHRIELGEIEANIKKCPDVNDCAVIAVENQDEYQLAAFFTQEDKRPNNKPKNKLKGYFGEIENVQYDVDEDLDFFRYCYKERGKYIQRILMNIPEFEEYVVDKYKDLILHLYEESRNVNVGQLEIEESNAIKLESFMRPYINHFKEIISDRLRQTDIVTMDEFVLPGKISESMQGGKFVKNLFTKVIQELQKQIINKEQKIRILEIGARSIETTYQVLSMVSNVEYTIVDPSKYYLEQAKKALNCFEEVRYLQDSCVDIAIFALGLKPFDLIIANDTLHQMSNIPVILKNLKGYLGENGVLLIAEMAKEFPLADMSVNFLAGEYEDERKVTGKMLLNKEEWRALLNKENFDVVNILPKREDSLLYVYCVSNLYKSYEETTANIQDFLKSRIPSYMIPQYFYGLRTMSMTTNGKIDRRKLEKIFIKPERENESELSDTERIMTKIWEKILGVKVNKESNYFQAGGDSLLATRLSTEIRGHFGVDFSIELVFEKQTLSEMAMYIDELLTSKETINNMGMEVLKDNLEFIEDSEHRYEAFPLTDVQQAYWLGENDIFQFGGKSTQCYFGLECMDLDLERAQAVLNEMIKTNDTLRLIVNSDGQTQKILQSVPEYIIRTYNASGNENKESIILEMREEMSKKVYEWNTWPLFDIRFVKTDTHRGYLGISFDNILMDGWSMFFMLKEWSYLYYHPEEKSHKCQITFRDYVLNYERIRNNGMHERDWKYWMDKKKEIYPAPELPVRANVKELEGGFKRFSYKVSPLLWNTIRKISKEYKITPAALLLSAYAEVISRWSGNNKFSINLTNFNRIEFHPDVKYLMGDFTALTIHSIDMDTAENFVERTSILQEKMWKDLSHSYVSGVEIERYLNRTNYSGMMPIVYTCGLGLDKGLERNYEKYLGKMKEGRSFTPQVWIDNQVSEESGALVITWDALVDIFPAYMVDEMFKAYIELVEALAKSNDIWVTTDRAIVNVQNEELRLDLNSTQRKRSNKTLLTGFQNSLIKGAEKIAIIDAAEEITYRELNEISNALAKRLYDLGIRKGDVVGIWIPKSAEQIISMLAILKCGAIYLPLKYDNPFSRNKGILEHSQAKCVVTDEVSVKKCEFSIPIVTIVKEYSTDEVLVEIQPNDLAYIIYTSGTTGIPKGVAITHEGAMNTIEDINRRISAICDDRTLAISDISFDLSVYDIFGMLSVGGCIVIPGFKYQREPVKWLELIEKYNVTIWNSVPMYMQMFVEYLYGMDIKTKCTLRTVLLSGDWIPIELKNLIVGIWEKAKVYGLGGATEASIWSNIYEINEINPEWRSIPYGKPLSNQRYYILDNMLAERPNNVPGNLYIAGDGLAAFYWKDDENTRRSFLYHPKTQERIYKTGDLAMYMEDGNICFLGRNDGQVKINGFRIELDEIDNYIRQKKEILFSASVEKNGGIYTFITAKSEINIGKIHEELTQLLPDYMVPRKITLVSEIPLSANGKVERKKLGELVVESEYQRGKTLEREYKITDDERSMLESWKEILNLEADFANVNESFLNLGGDSLKAIKIINSVSKKYGIEITLNALYQHPTISKLVKFIKEQSSNVDMGEI